MWFARPVPIRNLWFLVLTPAVFIGFTWGMVRPSILTAFNAEELQFFPIPAILQNHSNILAAIPGVVAAFTALFPLAKALAVLEPETFDEELGEIDLE